MYGPPSADSTWWDTGAGTSEAAIRPSANAEPIAGARVAAILCVPRTYAATTGADGSYDVVVPALYAAACSELDIEVSAAGYQPLRQTFLVADLRAQPERDFSLELAPVHRAWLPLIVKP